MVLLSKRLKALEPQGVESSSTGLVRKLIAIVDKKAILFNTW